MKRINIVVMSAIFAAMLVFAANPAAAQYKQINLVSDLTGMARYTDANMIDPWGMVFLPNGGFLMANARSGVATAYGPHGRPLPSTITIPPAPSQPFGPVGSPTGLVANPGGEFMVSKNGKSGPAVFLFDTLDGTISGWNPDVDPGEAVIVVDNSSETPFPASYTALAFAKNSKGQNVLYAADSGGALDQSNNRVDMYDGGFNYLGSFTDPSAPSNMTIFGIQNVNGKLYVTFAAFALMQGGVVDEFDTDGNLLERFASNGPEGPLEEPWAITRAPANFDQFSKALLIGNLGDGRINAYNPRTGKSLGPLADKHGTPISSGSGLWALGFPNTAKDEPARLFFTSGINGESDGLFGAIAPGNRDSRSGSTKR